MEMCVLNIHDVHVIKHPIYIKVAELLQQGWGEYQIYE